MWGLNSGAASQRHFGDGQQEKDGKHQDSRVLGRQREPREEAASRQSQNGGTGDIAEKSVNSGKQTAGHTEVCGHQGAMGENVRLEDEENQREERRASAEHGIGDFKNHEG